MKVNIATKTRKPVRDEQDSITVSREYLIRLERLANFDPLTGIANQARFQNLLQQALTARYAPKLLVAKIDVVQFHKINTSFGYLAGDALLMQIAERLTQLRDGQVARLEADIFAVALPLDAFGGTRMALSTLRAALGGRYVMPNGAREMHFSIGSTIASNGSDARALLRQTTVALRECKAARSGEPTQYDAAADERIRDRLQLTTDLRRALTNDELVVWYQPKVRSDSGAIVGVETLLRWNHSELGLLAPDRFIGLAEEAGLIFDVGAWVMRTAARFAMGINKGRSETLHVGVNVSPIQFTHPNFVAFLSCLLTETGVRADWFTLELTEGVFADNSPQLRRTFRVIRAMGFGLSIDDFGSGYSSLRYLDKFPISEVKIDRGFIRALSRNRYRRVIVELVVRIANALRIGVTAEGVETEAEWKIVRKLGCECVQGHLFSPPLAMRDFVHLVEQRSTLSPAIATPLRISSEPS